MRIVIKPLGAVALISALITLTFVSVRALRHTDDTAAPSVSVSTPTVTAAAVPSTAAPAATASKAPVPASGSMLDPAGFVLSGDGANAAQLNTLSQTRVPGATPPIYQIKVLSKAKYPWSIILTQSISQPIAQGQAMRLRFWARSSTRSSVLAAVEQDAPPYPKQVERQVALGPDWKEYTLSFVSDRAFASNGAKVSYQLGFTAGIIEITDVRLEADTR